MKYKIIIILLMIITLSGCDNSPEVMIDERGLGDFTCHEFCYNFVDDIGGMNINYGVIENCKCKCYNNKPESVCTIEQQKCLK